MAFDQFSTRQLPPPDDFGSGRGVLAKLEYILECCVLIKCLHRLEGNHICVFVMSC